MKPLHWLWTYLKDWKNLLAHTVIGVLILCVAFFLPVKPIYRIIILILVVVFNIIRMKISKKLKQDKNKQKN